MGKNIVGRQLIHVIHHNKCLYDPKWFKKGNKILIIERLFYDDGTTTKRLNLIEKPEISYYTTLKNPIQRCELSVELKDCEKQVSVYDTLLKELANITNQTDFYNEVSGEGQNRRRKALHFHKDLHGSDINLGDHYIDKYIEMTGSLFKSDASLECAYGDIEVDGIEVSGFPEPADALAPINLMSYVYAPTKKLIVRINRQSVRPNPQIKEFEDNNEENLKWIFSEVNRPTLEKAKIIEEGVDWKEIFNIIKDDKSICRIHEVEIRYFQDELSLIKDFFFMLNEEDRPDVMAFWNISFDLPTIINRLKKLGVEPEDIICPKDFKDFQMCDFQEDTFHQKDPQDKIDITNVSGYTIYLDQMLIYANLRKSEGKKDAYTLDFTLKEELKEEKISHEMSIRDFPYQEFNRFVLYNAMDVCPMMTLEEKTSDIDLVYRLSLLTRTRIHHVLKKTVCLRNFANKFFRDKRLVLSNNRNTNNERSNESFKGGFVANPNLLTNFGIKVGGTASNRIFNDVVDFDGKSEYPSTIITFDVDPSAVRAKVSYLNKDNHEENGSEIVSPLISGNDNLIGCNWLNLPTLPELLDLINEKG